jgi:subtilase family serine protease
MKKSDLILTIILMCLLCLSGFASATTYSSPSGSSHVYNITASPGTHTFVVTGVTSERYTEWYVNGTLIRTDHSWIGNGYLDPQFSYTFVSGYTQIKAVLYDGSWNYLSEYHQWNCTVGQPDLVGSGAGVSDSTVDPEQTIQIYWAARNQGNASCGSSQQGIVWSTDPLISKSDQLLGREPLGPMISGQTSPESFNITIPISAIPGNTYYIGIIQDYDDDVAESNESNNTLGIPVTINYFLLPDLFVEYISLTPTQVYPGTTTFQRTVRVRNIGQSQSEQCSLRIQEDGPFSGLDIISIPSLSPSEPYTYQDFIYGTFSNLGTYSVPVWAIVDFDNEVVESNEDNNTGQEIFVINVVPEPLPDLVISDCFPVVVELLPGEPLDFGIPVSNQGQVPAGQNTLRYDVYVDNIHYFASFDRTCPPLNPGQCYTFSETVILPTLSPGNHTVRIYVQADYYDVVAESNENNNSAQITIPIVIKGLHLQSPNGSEELVVDSNSLVQWQTYGTIPTVNLDVSIDGGTTWEALESGLDNTNQYEWYVTEYWASPTCLLRVSDASNVSIFDESESTFQTFVCTLNYDLDGDCFVDLADIALLATEWLKSGNPYNN